MPIKFSKEAIKNLNNCDFDCEIKVVKSYWNNIFLLAVSVLVLAISIWGFTGSLTESVSGLGITLPTQNVQPIYASENGIIRNINLHIGDRIHPFSAVGYIYNEKTNKRTLVTSNSKGRVIEVLKEEGGYVTVGEKIALTVPEENKGVYLVAYIPAYKSKNIKNGMSAFFSPATAPYSEYGYMKAVVRQVGENPVNEESIGAELMNKSLVRQVNSLGPVIKVVLELIPDQNTYSGYKWTSKKGWKNHIEFGMIGEVIITTSYRTPASYVIPALREIINQKKELD